MDIASTLDKLKDDQSGDESIFVLLDGALLPAMQLVYGYEPSPQACPVYYGTPHETCLEVSPCLYEPKGGSSIWDDSENWRGRGVIFTSRYSFFDVLKHLQSLISVSLPSGQLAYWRFYSPDWLASIMDVFETEDIIHFTGPISQWAAFTEDGWQLYRPQIAEEPIHNRDEGWFYLSDTYIESWKSSRREQFILDIQKRANEKSNDFLSETVLKEDISDLFDIAKEAGFTKKAELERFIFLFLKNPDAIRSSEYLLMVKDASYPPMTRLDTVESKLFGMREEERV
ncbi:protein of unknown function [Franzmannia pantelleriensis]|uniref:DUF4123 domain-containing protein n=1 Tax=Franzmannia pantelleriensis TaxID=48727 RepID=A0A1G9WWC1_9GAMM|nr:DUF4123 domain-containing protein [Halomonas pantelleriensis]SDM88767.1 protein of unknown function [Halomonas pantelleriensis]